MKEKLNKKKRHFLAFLKGNGQQYQNYYFSSEEILQQSRRFCFKKIFQKLLIEIV